MAPTGLNAKMLMSSLSLLKGTKQGMMMIYILQISSGHEQIVLGEAACK